MISKRTQTNKGPAGGISSLDLRLYKRAIVQKHHGSAIKQDTLFNGR